MWLVKDNNSTEPKVANRYHNTTCRRWGAAADEDAALCAESIVLPAVWARRVCQADTMTRSANRPYKPLHATAWACKLMLGSIKGG